MRAFKFGAVTVRNNLSLSVLVCASALMFGACADSEAEAPNISSGESQSPAEVVEFDYAKYLEALKQATSMLYGLTEFPDTSIVRFVSIEERPYVWEACMLEAGWEVSVSFDGAMVSPLGLLPEQTEAFAWDDYICFAQYPVDDTKLPVFGEEQIRITYDYYADVLTPCLKGRGVQVIEPPTWQEFRRGWVPDGLGGFVPASADTWFPYDAVDPNALSEEDWEALNVACPQNPPSEVLWRVAEEVQIADYLRGRLPLLGAFALVALVAVAGWWVSRKAPTTLTDETPTTH